MVDVLPRQHSTGVNEDDRHLKHPSQSDRPTVDRLFQMVGYNDEKFHDPFVVDGWRFPAVLRHWSGGVQRNVA